MKNYAILFYVAKAEESKSLWEEPSNVIYICLAAAIVLVFLVLLTCIIYKKHM